MTDLQPTRWAVVWWVDAQRRAVVFDQYAKGEPTAAAREELVRGTRISRAVE